MEFSWTPEQQELFAAAREAGSRVGWRPGDRAQGNGDPGPDPSSWRACADFGLAALCLPEAHGGMGLDLLTSSRVIEGFAQTCPDLGLLFSAGAHLFACSMPIWEFGCPELHRRALPKLARGEWIGANAITEDQAGSDVLALRTRAERAGDVYRLTGSKSYVTNGPVADVAVVYASTDPSAGYLSLSAFAVELDRPGVTVGKPFETIGLTGSTIGSIYLDECEVPASHLLGSEGQGAVIFDRSMQIERACLFAAYLGAMQRQLAATVEYARTRHQFGRPIGKNQAVSHRIADMKLRLEAARMLVYRACWLMDCGKKAALDISLAKLAVSEGAVQSGLEAIQIHGGMGVVTAAGIDSALRDAIPATIFSGTSELQREIIATRLGL